METGQNKLEGGNGGPADGASTERLRAQEEFYKSIIEGAADVTTLVEPDGKILYASASIANEQTSLGYDPKELVGQNTLYLIHPDDQPAVVQAMVNDLAGKPTTVEGRARRRDGSWMWVEMRGKAIVGLDGKQVVVAYSRNIDDRKRLQEQLKKSEEYYKSLLEGSSDLIAVADRQGTVRFVSDSIQRILGRRPDEVLGKQVLSLVHPDDLATATARWTAAGKSDSQLIELRLQRRDGTWCACEETGRIIDGPEGEPLVLINVRDISERKRIDREHALLAAIVESSDDAIVSNSLDQRITTWNKGAERLFGYTAEEAIGQPAGLYIAPEWRTWGEVFLDDLKTRIEGAQSFEMPCRCKDGRHIDVWTVCGAIRDRNGKLVGISTIHRDLTQRKRAEREQALLAALVKSSDDAIVSHSTDFRITSWNRGAQRMLGYTADEVLGKRPFDVYAPPADRAFARTQMARDLAAVLESTEAIRQIEVPLLRKDGASIEVSIVGCGIRDANGKLIGLSSIMRDVTERKRAEREQALLAALVKSSEDAIVSYSTDFHITSWNRGAQRLLGYTADEALGKRPFDLYIPPANRAEDQARLEKDLATIRENPEAMRQFEMPVLRKDGAILDMAVTGCGIHDASGRLIGLSTIMHDITARKKIEQEKAALAAIVESSDDAINSIGLDGRITYWNHGAEKMFGFTAAEAIGKPITLHIPPDRHGHAAEITSFLRAHPDEVIRFEGPNVRKDGTLLEVSTVCFAIRDREGKAVAVASSQRDVTERNRGEREKASLAAIVETSDDAISSIGPDRRITYWNPGAEKMFGYTAAEAIGQPVTICAPPDHRTHLQEVVETLIKHPDQAIRFETPVLRKDGTLVDASTVCVAIRDREGRFVGVSAIQRDITDRKRAEREMALLAAIVNASQDAIITVSPNLKILSWNPAATTAYGYADTEAIGKGIELFVPPDELQETIARAARVVETGQPQSWEHHPATRDGRKFVHAVNIFPIRDETGQIMSLGGIGRDITERKQVERQVASLAAIVNASQDAIMTVSKEGTIRFWNPAAERVYGHTAAEAIGQGLELFVPREDLEQTIAATRRVVETRQPFSFEQRARNAEGDWFISAVNIFPMPEPEGPVTSVGSIGRDITALKDTQRELVAAREAALAASQAKSEFLSSMSHEIRTPMTAILGMAELLSEGELNPEQRRYIDILGNNGHALLDLINSILDLAKIESGRLTLEHVAFDLNEVVVAAAQTLAIRADAKGLELIVSIAPDVPTALLGDPLRLRQVLINLIGNAIKFTERGEVLVAIERDSDPDQPLRLKFSVRDTGIGIAKDKLPLLFAAFSQADSSTARKYGGSGLGLAIVKRLVTLMQGEVTLESELGKGSTFGFTSPFEVQADAQTAALPTPDLAQVPVLIVDGNATERSVLHKTLAWWGAGVTEVASYADGLKAIEQPGRAELPTRLVMLDERIAVPDGESIEQLIAAASRCGASLIAMIHCDNLAADISRLKSLKLENYLIKPIDVRELARAVRHALTRDAGEAPPQHDRMVATVADKPLMVDRPLKILFADDSVDNRTLVRAFLKKTPYRLEEVGDGRKAIDGFIAKGDYDLVLMDIQMPEVDGYAATRAIRAWEREHNHTHTPIIALTASVFPEAVRLAREAGCDGHLPKPISKKTLLRAIYEAVAGVAQV